MVPNIEVPPKAPLKVVATELVIEKMLLFGHRDENEIADWNMLDNDFEED